MKLSISLPDAMGGEIKGLAEKSERTISWWIQKAWTIARERILVDKSAQKRHREALKGFFRLRGSLKKHFPDMDSVTLAHRAFTLKDFKK